MTKKALLLIIISFLISTAFVSAQTSTMQLIHNAAGVSLDTVDVYLNKIKFNNLRFRTSSPELYYTEGDYVISINHKSSSDSGNQKLYSQKITLKSGDRLVLMIQGVEDTLNYVPNPLGKNIRVSLKIIKLGAVPTDNFVRYTFLNGITDSRKLNALPRNMAQVFESVEYEIYSNSFSSLSASIPPSYCNSPKIVDLTSEDREIVYGVKQFPINTSAFINKTIVLVASGFLNPELNNNGAKADIFAVNSTGGAFISGTKPVATGFQLIHNSPDVMLDSVDIYVNSTKYDNVAFRQSLPFLNLAPGTYPINFNDKNSTDSSNLVKYRYVLKLDTGSAYVLVTKGVLNPSMYLPNPNNSNLSFSIQKIFVDYRNAASINYNQYQMANGNPDSRYNELFSYASTMFPVEFGETNKLAGAMAIGEYSKLSMRDDVKSILSTRISPSIKGDGRLHMLLSSGFYNPNQLSQIGQSLELNVYDSSGIRQELKPSIVPLQVIHNSADITLDTIDIYFNGIKIDNLAFRNATKIISVYEGEYNVTINHKNSLNSKDQVIATLTVNIINSSTTTSVCVLSGLVNPALYAPNPNGLDRGLKFVISNNIGTNPSTNKNNVCFFHGITDLETISISSTPISSEINFSSLSYGKNTAALGVPNSPTLLNINLNNAYMSNMQDYQRNTLVFFLSGFKSTSTNQNGSSKGLYMASKEGGPAILLDEGCRVQFIHTSLDSALGNINIWKGEKQIVSNLTSGNISPALLMSTNDSLLTVTKSSSTNSKTDILWTDSATNLQKGNSYYIALNGWLNGSDTSGKKSFKASLFNFYDNSKSPNQLNITFFNSAADGSSARIDIQRSGENTPTKITNLTPPRTFSSSSSIKYPGIYTLREILNERVNRAFKLSLNSSLFDYKQGVLYTNENTGSAQPSYYLGFLDGTRVELPQRTSQVQFIHASADTAVQFVDLYLNGLKTIDSFEYTKATPLLTVSSNAQVSVKVIKHGSNDTTSLINSTLTLDSASKYYAVLNGVSAPNQFASNPSGINTELNIATDKRLLTKGTSGNNKVDLMYFHGVPDAPSTNCAGKNQPAYLSYLNPFKSFQQYSPHNLLSNIIYDVFEIGSNKIMYSASANLSGNGGKAGIVVFSGFKNLKPNLSLDSMRLILYWPDGSSQKFSTYIAPIVGLDQQHVEENLATLYPNPANSFTTLQLQLAHKKAISVRITNMEGSLIWEERKNMNPGTYTQLIDLGHIKSGAYVCSVSDGEQTIHLKLLVIHE